MHVIMQPQGLFYGDMRDSTVWSEHFLCQRSKEPGSEGLSEREGLKDQRLKRVGSKGVDGEPEQLG